MEAAIAPDAGPQPQRSTSPATSSQLNSMETGRARRHRQLSEVHSEDVYKQEGDRRYVSLRPTEVEVEDRRMTWTLTASLPSLFLLKGHSVDDKTSIM